MKHRILILLSILSFSPYAQTVEIGNDLFSDGGASQKDMIVTNNGDVIIAFRDGSAQGYIEILKYDGTSWTNTMGAGNYVDSLCGNLKLVYNSTNDSIFLGYLKNDGFYLRSFVGSWSAPEYYNGMVTTGSSDNHMLGAINEDSNIPFFMYEANNGVALTMVSYDYNSSSFVEYAVPDKGLNGLVASDLVFDQSDGFIYYSHNSETTGAVIERYNGIGWSDLDGNMTALNEYTIEYSKIFQIENQNEIICMYSYDTGGGSNNDRYGINKYNCSDNAKEILLVETSEAAGILRGAAYKNELFYADFSVFGYSGTSEEVNWEQSLVAELRKDFSFDDQGYLYWNKNIGPTENVFRSGPFVLGVNEIDSDEKYFIFPNPATNQIQISSEESNSISFYSIDGALIKADLKVSKSQPLNIDFLSKGLYVVMLENPEGVVSQQRIVVE
jgi:hypothetical protein